MARPINLIVVHCSDSLFGDRALIDAWHRGRGFDSVGYHFIIQNGYPDADSLRLHRPRFWLDGTVEYGRPVDQAGAHAKGRNHDSIGICLVGREQFTHQQFEALAKLILELQREYPAAVMGHYEVRHQDLPPKTCPNLDMDWVRGLLKDEG